MEKIAKDLPLKAERIDELTAFQGIISYIFKDIGLLNRSLTHKSFAYESNPFSDDNEILEFLGDAVLDLVVRDYGIKRFSHFSEGQLSKFRAQTVSSANLAKIARRVNLGKFLLLGKGEENSGGRNKNSILADGLEAVVGAIYLDGGYQAAYNMVMCLLGKEIDDQSVESSIVDFKSELQEYTQDNLGCVPEYRVTKVSGPDHAKVFEVELFFKDQLKGKGTGKSKKVAEQMAAKAALEEIFPAKARK